MSVTNDVERRAAMETWIEGISKEETRALLWWSSDGYRRMRAADSGVLAAQEGLSDDEFASERLHVALVRSVMARAPRYEGVVFRGMLLPEGGGSGSLYETLTRVGGEYTQEGLASWGWKKSKANSFANDQRRSVVLKVRTTRGASIDDARTSSMGDRETEVLIDRGVRYRVVSVTDDPESQRGRKIIELEELD